MVMKVGFGSDRLQHQIQIMQQYDSVLFYLFQIVMKWSLFPAETSLTNLYSN